MWQDTDNNDKPQIMDQPVYPPNADIVYLLDQFDDSKLNLTIAQQPNELKHKKSTDSINILSQTQQQRYRLVILNQARQHRPRLIQLIDIALRCMGKLKSLNAQLILQQLSQSNLLQYVLDKCLTKQILQLALSEQSQRRINMGINNDDIIIVKNMLIDGDNRDKIREMLGKLEIN